jgi:hypothetical protein
MKYMLIVRHDEEAFCKIEKEQRQQMLAESIELTPASRRRTVPKRLAAAAGGHGGHGASARR